MHLKYIISKRDITHITVSSPTGNFLTKNWPIWIYLTYYKPIIRFLVILWNCDKVNSL